MGRAGIPVPGYSASGVRFLLDALHWITLCICGGGGRREGISRLSLVVLSHVFVEEKKKKREGKRKKKRGKKKEGEGGAGGEGAGRTGETGEPQHLVL